MLLHRERNNDCPLSEIAQDFRLPLKKQLPNNRTAYRIQFVPVHSSFQSLDVTAFKPTSQSSEAELFPRNPPYILSGSRIDFNDLESEPVESFLQKNSTLCQRAHGSKRDREEANSSPMQFPVAGTKMFPVSILDSLSAWRQIKWRVDRDDVWY